MAKTVQNLRTNWELTKNVVENVAWKQGCDLKSYLYRKEIFESHFFGFNLNNVYLLSFEPKLGGSWVWQESAVIDYLPSFER